MSLRVVSKSSLLLCTSTVLYYLSRVCEWDWPAKLRIAISSLVSSPSSLKLAEYVDLGLDWKLHSLRYLLSILLSLVRDFQAVKIENIREYAVLDCPNCFSSLN